MRAGRSGLGMTVLAGALVFGAAPASAGNTDKSSTRELAAQSRITVFPRSKPGPNSKRHCHAWLAKEYRVSGTVIVPRMQCWWD